MYREFKAALWKSWRCENRKNKAPELIGDLQYTDSGVIFGDICCVVWKLITKTAGCNVLANSMNIQ